jgi:DNA-binding CsgD family transcriptional regulator
LFGCVSDNQSFAILEEGEMHVNADQILKNKELNIKGNALFYWKQWPLDDNGAFQQELLTKPDTIQWPSPVWKHKGYTPKGFGTFCFSIKPENPAQDLVLHFSRVLGASEVWVNGKQYAVHGNLSKISSESENAVPAFTVPLPNEANLDVMILVSNFSSRFGGGFPLKNVIALKESFHNSVERRATQESLITIIIILFGFFQLITYTNFQKEKYFLFFGLFCLVGGSRQLFVGDTFIIKIFPDISFEVVQRLRYICYYGGLALIFLYHHYLFHGYFSKKIVLFFTLIPCLGVLYVLLFPVYYGTYSAPVFQILGFLSLVMWFWLITKAIIDKKPFAKLVLLNAIIITIVFTNDMLNAMLIIQTEFLVNVGLLTYVVFQVYLNYRIVKAAQLELKMMTEKVLNKEAEISKLLFESYHHLKSKRELVNDLKKTTYDDTVSVETIISNLRSELLEDNQLNVIKNDIEKLNYYFIQRLKTRAPKLTQTDVELCTYIYIGLNRKEIARLRHITVEGVKKARYRLRKKLELSADKDLENFLKDV